ncbi:MAG: hypothetical protein AAF570_19620, partial [Bacteroidota bacterium]
MKKKFKIAGIVVVGLIAVAVGAYFIIYRDIPYYKKMEKTRLKKFTKDNISLATNVICHNPNNIAIRLAGCDFDVYANGKHVTTVKQNYTTTIGAASDFKVPLT